ncbi:MAG: glycosyltransferase family 4 protein [Desulfobacula sp.]|jgi:O-antigen biosynthesis alpha-1,2-rhamnosyltransferase|uniref:glycosyltransferase family 4 protein n=1 Tax=Desulfobacula sp. TaxID=2593537 RepID=UPI001DE99584|nr:glycosyltransferase family 4 protein [Desulfobacula sp.]MBT3485881.1 glycosyltransferase family 4 protein [Desulfobacula sp.]MBT3805484.1 glycosyltransferase family 4 protein [Desulfobacula sp.]MBT4026801.1 glycosyltransferase family 4 protein [Desulfobacula sp.]MBT4199595.1 glycosyltransferase family 4 protein [Desulfobacula sp.]
MSKLYIDFSDTYFSKAGTGIQRVVRNILIRKKTFKHYGFDEVTGVVQSSNSFYKLEYGKTLSLNLKNALFFLATKLRHLVDFIFKFINRGKNITLLKEIPEKNYVTMHIKIILFSRHILKYLFKIMEYIDTLFLKNQKISFSKNDILFLPDAFWSKNFSTSAVRKAKKSGAKIIVLLHDIFPFTHSEFVEERHLANFKKKFPKIIKSANGFICNSEFTLSEITNHLNKHYKDFKQLPSDFFHLGCNFDSKSVTHNVSSKKKNAYLMVGTIEPRKNHDFVLDVFEKYWSQGGTGQLCIVGKIGWDCELTMTRILKSAYYNKCLFFFNRVSDSDLGNFYSSCKSLIFASIVEGFGLPIVEAMAYNKIVFASNIPVFKEISKKYPFYFDLDNSDSLLELIKKLEAGQLNLQRKKPALISWNDSINQLALKISKLPV